MNTQQLITITTTTESNMDTLQFFDNHDINIDDETKYLSVYNIMAMFGIRQNRRQIIIDKYQKSYSYIFKNMIRKQINNRGKIVPLLSAQSCVHLVWVLPGDLATNFRKQAAEYITRLIAGDRTLINEIELQHERINPELQTALLNYAQPVPELLATKQELINIEARSKIDSDERKAQIEKITKLEIENKDLSTKYVKMVTHVDKMKTETFKQTRRANDMATYHLRPQGALMSTLVQNSAKYIEMMYDEKIKKIEEEFENESADIFENNVANALHNKQRICENAVNTLSKGDENVKENIDKIVKASATAYYKKMEQSHKEDFKNNYKTQREMANRLKQLEESAIKYDLDVKEKYKDYHLLDAYQQEIISLKRNISRNVDDIKHKEKHIIELREKNALLHKQIQIAKDLCEKPVVVKKVQKSKTTTIEINNSETEEDNDDNNGEKSETEEDNDDNNGEKSETEEDNDENNSGEKSESEEDNDENNSGEKSESEEDNDENNSGEKSESEEDNDENNSGEKSESEEDNDENNSGEKSESEEDNDENNSGEKSESEEDNDENNSGEKSESEEDND